MGYKENQTRVAEQGFFYGLLDFRRAQPAVLTIIVKIFLKVLKNLPIKKELSNDVIEAVLDSYKSHSLMNS